MLHFNFSPVVKDSLEQKRKRKKKVERSVGLHLIPHFEPFQFI